MKLTNYFLKKKIRSMAGAASARDHQYCPLQEAGSILLVYDQQDRELAEMWVKQLSGFNKQVNRCVYDTSRNPEQEESPYFKINSATDTNALEIPKEDIVINFNRIPADILIDLSRSSAHVMHYLVLNHPSRFKVGRKHSSFSMHDLVISMTEEEDVNLLFGHILFYLQTIRSK